MAKQEIADMPEIDVLREDQQRINLFGRLNNKKHFIADTIKDIKASTHRNRPSPTLPLAR